MAKTDKKTLELIAQVKQQKAEIAKAEKPAYKTNCTFSYIEGKMSDAVNIHVESNVKNLICIAAFLQEREKSYVEAAKVLGVETPPEFNWNGSTVKEWIDDIKMRISKIQIGAKRKKLEALEERLNKIISPELRAELELEAIASELS